jgi:hypothetical protein
MMRAPHNQPAEDRMSELRVPTVAVEAEVLCADGRAFRGRIFLPASASAHAGPMRPAEWMNDKAPFFPFLPEGGQSPVLLNKHEVLVLTVPDSPPEVDPAADVAPVRDVVVEVRDRSVRGALHLDMPAHLLRVADYLNRPDPFLIVTEEGRSHLIRKARITRVIEQA